MLHAQTVIYTAVGYARVIARCPFNHGVFDKLGIHARDLRHSFGSELLQVLSPQIPCRTADMRTSVLKPYLDVYKRQTLTLALAGIADRATGRFLKSKLSLYLLPFGVCASTLLMPLAGFEGIAGTAFVSLAGVLSGVLDVYKRQASSSPCACP